MYQIENIKSADLSQIRELQKETFEILKYFKEFCQKHDLTFYFCGGCAIGALRNKGYIPWDDDVDLFMPRKDYEKLKEIWEKEKTKEEYVYCRTDREKNYHHGGASIRNKNTTFINKHSIYEDICHGIGIEIMPIDASPKSGLKRYIQLYNAFLFGIFNTQRLPDNKGKTIRFITRICYFFIPSKKVRYQIWSKAEKRMSKYSWDDASHVTELIGSLKGMLYKHPKEWFSTSKWVDFEGELMPVMSGVENYITLIFGDIYELPPIEKRIPKHDTVFIDVKQSYLKYKGKYYLTKKG